jgi:hypothetical protein
LDKLVFEKRVILEEEDCKNKGKRERMRESLFQRARNRKRIAFGESETWKSRLYF